MQDKFRNQWCNWTTCRQFCFVDRASLYNLANISNYVNKSVQFTYLFLFSTCFGHPCAPHQDKIAENLRRWYLSNCMDCVRSAGWSEKDFFLFYMVPLTWNNK